MMELSGKDRREWTWRTSAMILLALLMPLQVLPLIFLQPNEASRPACCRRNGKHHCMMNMVEHAGRVGNRSQIEAPLEKCPYAPASVVPVGNSQLMAVPRQAIFAGLVSHPTIHIQTESHCRISRERSRHKRGPPSAIFL